MQTKCTYTPNVQPASCNAHLTTIKHKQHTHQQQLPGIEHVLSSRNWEHKMAVISLPPLRLPERVYNKVNASMFSRRISSTCSMQQLPSTNNTATVTAMHDYWQAASLANSVLTSRTAATEKIHNDCLTNSIGSCLHALHRNYRYTKRKHSKRSCLIGHSAI